MDVESKLPSGLELHFIVLRPEERVAALLVLLKTVIDQNEQTVVFAPTKHHVEYLHMVTEPHVSLAAIDFGLGFR